MPSIDIDIVWWAFMIGMASHLIMDTFTKEGVPWLLPLPVKFGIPPFRAWRITTGKIGELGMFGVLVVFGIWFCATNYWAILDFFHTRIV